MIESHFGEDSNLESEVMFGHLESTLAVRCLAKNEMGTVSREIKLVSNGKDTPGQPSTWLLTYIRCYLQLPSDEQC